MFRFIRCVVAATVASVLAGRTVSAQSVISPVQLGSSLPYKVTLKPYDFGGASLPTLHSFSVGEYESKYVFISGRTNGLHTFDLFNEPFPAQYQNRDVWVVDLVNKQSWSRSLGDATSGLTEAQIRSLSTTNNQFYQSGDTLYMTGGYGTYEDESFGTHDRLTAIDLPGLGDWVINGGALPSSVIRQSSSPTVQVTGGAMYEMNGRTHIVFGQDFQGAYHPFADGMYTNQIRSFDIIDDGVNPPTIANVTATTPDDGYRRRDLNVVPVVRPDGAGGTVEGLVALSGVFTVGQEAWTVPVEIDASGTPSGDEESDPGAFHQGMNNYHSSKVGLYSQNSSGMHELLFGGISLQYFDETTQAIETDFGLPFVNDVTSIVIDAQGNFSQHHLGFFPEVLDENDMRLRFGTNSEFLLAGGVPTFGNGVINLDALSGATTVGFIYGGIASNAPHTRFVPGAQSAASNRIFEVVVTVVPEPSPWQLIAVGMASGLGLTAARRRDQHRM